MSAMSDRARWIWFSLFVITCIAATAGYIRWRVDPSTSNRGVQLLAPDDPAVIARIDQLRKSPHLVFLNSRAGAFGRISVADPRTPESTVVLASVECERAHFGKTIGVCLALNHESVQPRAFAYLLDARFRQLAELPLAGLPIRARVSADQRYAAATVFVTGESYGGDFTTRTTIIDIPAQRAIADLEQFTVERNGKRFSNVDFNFWGVTFFRDSNAFFATLGTGGQRLLVRGDIAQRRMEVVDTDVECPSLSPDERHLVFKRQQKNGRGWQFWAMDVQTRERWPITEDGQNVDDQAEWFDDDTVIYGIVGSGPPETAMGLWTSDIARERGMNQSRVGLAGSSPALVR
jgi:hypothetical protein